MNRAKDRQPLEQLLVCPYDYAALVGNGNAYMCDQCSRTFPLNGNVINFLAYEAAFKSLSYAIPWHPVPNEGRFNRVLSWLRSLPIYYRLLITSNHFSFYVERYIRKTMKGRKTVLDVGCREGHNLMFGKRVDLAVGIDVDYDSAVFADRWSPNNCHALLASGTRLPFRGECFDFVICTEVIEHLEDYIGLVEQIARVTKKGGQVLLSTPDGNITPIPNNPLHLKHFRESELREIFGSYFRQVRIRSIVTNCKTRDIYWQAEKNHPRARAPLLLLNAITNLIYYLAGYHKEEAHKRKDILGAQFVVLAVK